MRQLADDLDVFARRHGLRRGVEAAAVLKTARQVCRDILPTELAEQARPASFRLGTLFIEAPTGAALALLASYRETISKKISDKIGPGLVRRVIVRAATIEN